MAERKPLFLNDDGPGLYGFHEEMQPSDTITLGGLTMGGDIAMGTYHITNLGTPNNSADAATKQYVDDVAAGLAWKEPVAVLSMMDDSDQGGSPPTAGMDGEAWVVNNWGLPYNDGDIVEWDGVQWNVIVPNSGAEPPDGQRVLVIDAGAAGSFVGKENQFATYNATTDSWSFVTPVDGDAVLVDGNGSINENCGYTYTGSLWVQFTGAGLITAGSGLDKVGNTLSIDYGNGVHDDGAGQLEVHLASTDPGLEFRTGGDAGKLGVWINGTTLSLVGGLHVLGVPSQFTIGGPSNSVSTNVTHTNLNTLTGGVNSDASSLHIHKKLRVIAQAFEALSLGDPVYQSATSNQVGKARADTDAKSFIAGVAEAAQPTPGNDVPIIRNGSVAEGVLSTATAGARYWLQPTGGIGTALPGSGKRLIQIGIAKNASDLWVDILDYGKKA